MEDKNIEISTGIYRHYKGGIYEVVAAARHSETLEPMVVYRNVVSGMWWVRPASMWNETVVHDGISEPRFTYIADDVSGIK